MNQYKIDKCVWILNLKFSLPITFSASLYKLFKSFITFAIAQVCLYIATEFASMNSFQPNFHAYK